MFFAFFALTVFAAYYKNARISSTRHRRCGYRHTGGGVPIFKSPASTLSRDASRSRVLVLDERAHCGPFAVLISAKIALSITQFSLDCTLSIAWATTTLIALYCVRSGNVVQHRRWVIRSYPWAMTFTFNRIISVFLPSTRVGHSGFEAKIWLSAVLAAFLPTIVLEWRAIFSRSTARLGTMAE